MEGLRDAMRGRRFEALAVDVAEGEPRRPGHLPRGLGRGHPYWYLGELDWAQPAILRTVESLLAATP